MEAEPIEKEIPQLLTADDLAALFSCDPMHIYRLAWAKRLPSVKIGRLRRFHPEAIAAMIANGGTTEKSA